MNHNTIAASLTVAIVVAILGAKYYYTDYVNNVVRQAEADCNLMQSNYDSQISNLKKERDKDFQACEKQREKLEKQWASSLHIVKVAQEEQAALEVTLQECNNNIDNQTMAIKNAREKLNKIQLKQISPATTTTEQVLDIPYLFAITPTYRRQVQKSQLVRLKQTFLHVKNFHWIIVEDANKTSDLVTKLFQDTTMKYTILATTHAWNKSEDKVWASRNAGLNYILGLDKDTRGVVFFADDDYTYDLDIFEQVWTPYQFASNIANKAV